MAAAKRGMPAVTAAGSHTVAELEAEVAKLRKSLAEACMERDVIEKLRRTLLGSRCPVRANENDATRLSGCAAVSCFWRLAQRVLCMAGAQAFGAPER